ncbi:MAG: ATP synthase F1 subunit delta [Candidatus Gastranaerophilales bacterium]|nr:ATP synthase F1 subunit delta [Candidatus Gastranaerophilales bacterium]
MANINLKQNRIAKRYAKALFDEAKASSMQDEVLSNLKFVVDTCKQSPDLKDFLENPIISTEDKIDAINTIFKENVSNIVYNFFVLLLENKRFDVLESVVSNYIEMLDEMNNILKIKVTSAVEMNGDLKNKLISKIENKTQKKVIADYLINPEIIAGLVIDINGKIIDSSLKTKLKGLQKQLI